MLLQHLLKKSNVKMNFLNIFPWHVKAIKSFSKINTFVRMQFIKESLGSNLTHFKNGLTIMLRPVHAKSFFQNNILKYYQKV